MSYASARDTFHRALQDDLAAFIHRCFQYVVPGTKFAPNWHVEAIAYELTRCYGRDVTRSIINVPPRSLKSLCTSVAFPAWILGRDPSARIICVSYSNELSEKHARDCLLIMQSAWYRALFPRTVLDKTKSSRTEFTTTRKGYRLATSVEGTLTGRGGNFIIIDDPLKPQDAYSAAARKANKDWFDSTLYSRLDNKEKDVILLVMQRLHQDDLVEHVSQKEPWSILCIPAIATEEQDFALGNGRVYHRRVGELIHPARESQEALDGIRASLGSALFDAQYRQRPVPPEGGLIEWRWFKEYKELPPDYTPEIVQSWDTASKAGELNDYSVCTTWACMNKNYYLLDVFRKRMTYPELKRQVENVALRWNASEILIEDAGTGTTLLQEVKYVHTPSAAITRRVKPSGDKVVRMTSQTSVIEQGRVYAPVAAPWLAEFRRELCAFPNGSHDDQVDSVSQFLRWKARGPTCVAVPNY